MKKRNPADKQQGLIYLLRKNARASLTEMSGSLGLSVSRVHNILAGLMHSEVRRTCCMPDFRKLGFPIMVSFAIKAKERDNFLRNLSDEHCINEIVRINNGHDFLLEAYFKDMAALYAFSEKIKGLSISLTEYHVVEELKREEMCSNELNLAVMLKDI